MVADDRFRSDLCDRLDVFPLVLQGTFSMINPKMPLRLSSARLSQRP
jgi:hypothetical protein